METILGGLLRGVALTEKPQIMEDGLRSGFTYLASRASVYTLAKNGRPQRTAEASHFACWGISPNPGMDRRNVLRLRTVPALIFPLADTHGFSFPP